jgi:hypothetical protein
MDGAAVLADSEDHRLSVVDAVSLQGQGAASRCLVPVDQASQP